jgi:hypothetical protein
MNSIKPGFSSITTTDENNGRFCISRLRGTGHVRTATSAGHMIKMKRQFSRGAAFVVHLTAAKLSMKESMPVSCISNSKNVSTSTLMAEVEEIPWV